MRQFSWGGGLKLDKRSIMESFFLTLFAYMAKPSKLSGYLSNQKSSDSIFRNFLIS